WARRFLFRIEQLDTPVERLSGGEQARILIARLMLRPADLLILDEPTNDLDIPSLEVLEEARLEFPAAVVLVTHDRYLLDRVSTQRRGGAGDGHGRTPGDYKFRGAGAGEADLARAARVGGDGGGAPRRRGSARATPRGGRGSRHRLRRRGARGALGCRSGGPG